MYTRVKVCGVKTMEVIQSAVAAGVDAIGFVFYPKSPRSIDLQQFLSLTENWPPFVSRVGLWVNADEAEVSAVLDTGRLDVLQFHGSESKAYCEQFNRAYIKAIRPGVDTDWQGKIQAYPSAQAILLDAGSAEAWGGTGNSFDWSLWPNYTAQPLILAGGLTVENVGKAIDLLHPYAVDVSGGVESAPGIKDSDKVVAFMKEVKGASGLYE